MLKTTMSGHGTRRDKVVEGKTIEGLESTSWTLDSLVNHLSRRIGHIQIIASSSGVLDIVLGLELLEALHTSIVNILGIGDKLRRRKSVGSRHLCGGRVDGVRHNG